LVVNIDRLRCIDFIKFIVEPSCSEDGDEQLEDEESKSDKAEAQDLTTSESSEESIVDTLAALESCSRVCVNCNSHANVTGNNRSSRSNQVGSSSVWEVGVRTSLAILAVVSHLSVVDSEANDDCKDSREDSEVQVLSIQEGNGSLSDLLSNELHSVHDLSSGNRFFVHQSFMTTSSICFQDLFDSLGVIHIDAFNEYGINYSPEDSKDRTSDDEGWCDLCVKECS